MSVFSDIHSNASRLISQGLSARNVDMMLSGAELLLRSGQSDSYYLMEPLLNNGPELARRFLELISNNYAPVGSDGTVKSDYFTVLFMLEGFGKSSQNGLHGRCAEIVGAINTQVDAARKKQAEKSTGPTMIDMQKTLMCLHICQRCSPGCPLVNPNPIKRPSSFANRPMARA